MTSDEALIEKMAEAMWNGSEGPEEWLSWASLGDDSKDRIRHCAHAALSVVRENEKQGLVHAQSTGAERSSELSTGVVNTFDFNSFENGIYGYTVATWPAEREGAAQAETAPSAEEARIAGLHGDPTWEAIWGAIKGWDIGRHGGGPYAGANGTDVTTIYDAIKSVMPSGHRSAPAAPREPDLPSSLLSPLDHQGGLTKGKRL